MVDSGTYEGTDEPDDGKIPLWVRIVAGVLGLGAGVFGARAVFTSGNQAGTAALLLIAVVLTLIALQGTPMKQLRYGDSAFELERQKARGERVIHQIVESAPPEVAEAVAESISVVVPTLSPIAQRMLNGLSYEGDVGAALSRIGFVVEEQDLHSQQMNGVDFLISDSSGEKVGIECSFSNKKHRAAATNRLRELMRRLRDRPKDFPVLFVSNSEPVLGIRIREEVESARPQVSWVCWEPTAHDQKLRNAVDSARSEFYSAKPDS